MDGTVIVGDDEAGQLVNGLLRLAWQLLNCCSSAQATDSAYSTPSLLAWSLGQVKSICNVSARDAVYVERVPKND